MPSSSVGVRPGSLTRTPRIDVLEGVFHVKHGRWDQSAGSLGLMLSDRQRDQLDAYVVLLRERAVPLGFVAASDEPRLEERHVEDSLRAAAHVSDADLSAYDLGSGAGLPGVPVAIACPWLQVTLVESRHRRAAFLELAIERLGLAATVRVSGVRVETLDEPVSVCFARAFASARDSWAAAEPLLLPRGRLVYFGGERSGVSELPAGVRADVATATALARSGPLVIMTRT